jgi:mRNA interferase HicA
MPAIARGGWTGTVDAWSHETHVLCRATHLLYTVRLSDEPGVQTLAARQGCTFESGHGGHVIVRLGTRMSVLPMHGKQKELGTGLVNRIKKDLGLK